MIYVDKIRTYSDNKRAPKLKYKDWCHMISDTSTEELISFAVSIGLKPEWIQNKGSRYEHFDLTPNKRELAIANGAVFVNSAHEFVAAINRRESKKNAQ